MRMGRAQGVQELNMRMGHAPGVEGFVAKMQHARNAGSLVNPKAGVEKGCRVTAGKKMIAIALRLDSVSC